MKRYDIGLGVGHGGFQFGESADGDWVLWADVQQLIKETIVLRNEVRAAATWPLLVFVTIGHVAGVWIRNRRQR